MISNLYVYRPLLNGSALAQYATVLGLQNVVKPIDMHVTLAYSKEPVNWNLPDFRRNSETVIVEDNGDRRFDIFGDDALVLRFNYQPFNLRWAEFVMAGASWDYPTYEAHVTVAYGKQEVKSLPPPKVPLLFGGEMKEPLNEE